MHRTSFTVGGMTLAFSRSCIFWDFAVRQENYKSLISEWHDYQRLRCCAFFFNYLEGGNLEIDLIPRSHQIVQMAKYQISSHVPPRV
jgi:phenylalanine-4-hydroxylase